MREHRFVQVLEAVSHRLTVRLQAALVERGLDQAQIHVLSLIAADGPMSMSEVHRRFGHRASTVTAVVDRLERRGLVERRTNPADRRSVVVDLTGAGREVAAELDDALREVERDLAQLIGPGLLDELGTRLEVLDTALARVDTSDRSEPDVAVPEPADRASTRP